MFFTLLVQAKCTVATINSRLNNFNFNTLPKWVLMAHIVIKNSKKNSRLILLASNKMKIKAINSDSQEIQNVCRCIFINQNKLRMDDLSRITN